MKTFIAAVALILLASTVGVRAQDVQSFLREMREASDAAGVSQQTFDLALGGFTPDPDVIALDRKQPESKMTFDTYVSRTATESRIARGKVLYAQHAALLRRLEASYGVPGSVLLALWGMESSYGAAMGDYEIIPSLATLSYEGRRHDFFKAELIDALRIVDEGDVSPEQMLGSWAGAMGQVQFMPSTFMRYAVDYTGTGKRDIWRSTPDALASAANYLSQIGWDRTEPWGSEVELPVGIDPGNIGFDNPQSLATWKSLGLRPLNGTILPASQTQAYLLMPDGPGGRAFLVSHNVRVLMKWNNSQKFAITAGLIGDAISGRN